MLPALSPNLTLQEAFETIAQISEEPKRTEFEGAFSKKIQTSSRWIFFIFSLNLEKSVEKMIHQKKNRGHRMSTIVKPRKSYSNGHLPYHCPFCYLARAFMHDVACEFACVVRMRRNK